MPSTSRRRLGKLVRLTWTSSGVRSGRKPRHDEWRRRPSGVQLRYSTSPTTSGSTHSAPRAMYLGTSATGGVSRRNGASRSCRSCSTASVKPVPTPPAKDNSPSGVCTPSSNDPIVPARRPSPGFHPTINTSWVRMNGALIQSRERTPG